jgi:hypothetical protein
MANNPNIKFRSFVCQGLNDRLLHEWIALLTRNEPTMVKFYETWAYVRASEVSALHARPRRAHAPGRAHSRGCSSCRHARAPRLRPLSICPSPLTPLPSDAERAGHGDVDR